MIINNYLQEINSHLNKKEFAVFANFLKKEFIKTKKNMER